MPAGDRVTLPGHVQFGDLLLGPGTPYRWRELPGWEDSPPVDSGTVARPAAHGAFPGQLWAQPRTITVDKLVIRAPVDRIGATVRQLKAGTALSDDEQPLVVMLDERGPLLVWARCTRQAIPIGKGYRTGTVVGCALQFEASDPRRYSLVEQSAETGLARDEAGLDWHVTTAPPDESLLTLDYGTAGSTGTLTALNDGDADTPALLAIRGPISGPSLTDMATGRTWSYDIDLAASDELLVDGSTGTVTLGGASRLYSTTGAAEELLVIPPGARDFAFRAAPGAPTDPAARATLRWRHAYW